MNRKILRIILIGIVFICFSACKGGEEQEQKGTPQKKRPAYSLMYKPQDTYELLPEKTIVLMEEPSEGTNRLCISAVAKELDLARISGLSFDVVFDPEYITYKTHSPGSFEGHDKASFAVVPKEAQPKELGVKIGFEPGTIKSTGKDKLMTLCFEALQDGNITIECANGEVLDTRKNKIAEVTWMGGALWIFP
jgi:hypothetical protein